jgi:lipoprotein signal peptidase
MITLTAALAGVVLIDQAIKMLLRRHTGSAALSLGRMGSVRLVVGELWFTRFTTRSSGWMLWSRWLLAAGALVVASAWMPSLQLPVGLLLGGSASNAWERSTRGGVGDYVCLRFWPAFNLADVALTAGGIGIVARCMSAAAGAV